MRLQFALLLALVVAVPVCFGQQPSAGEAPPSGGAGQGLPGGAAGAGTAGSAGVPGSGTPTFTIRRTARLVVLDVVVTDKQGNVVRDLKKDNFHVTEVGTPQQILNFEETGAHVPDPAVTIDSTGDLDKLAPRAPVNIILLDEFNTRFEDMAFARYSLKKFLEKQPNKLVTPTMLIAVSLQNFSVLRDYTQDKNLLVEALDHHFVAYPWQAQQGQWRGERYGLAFETLRRVAQAVVGHPGHKNMIWIGRGFPALQFSEQQVDAEVLINNAVQDCVNTLRDARVTLYTIDPAGVMVDPGEYGRAAAFNDPFGGNYQFNKLATATGGRALYGRNDVDAEIGTTVRDGTSFYTLTYRPGDSNDPQKFRKIKVTIDDRPGVVATTREGYYLQRPPARVDPTNPSRRLAFDLHAAESSTMVYDGVPLTVTPVPGEADSFKLRVDAKGLAWTAATDTEPRRTEVIVMTTTFDKKGKELKRTANNVKFAAKDVPPTGRIERSVEMPVKLEHDPKAVRARFVVRVASSGRIGTADLPLGPL